MSYSDGRYYMYLGASSKFQGAFGCVYYDTSKPKDTNWHTWVIENNGSNAIFKCDGETVLTRSSMLNGGSIILCGSSQSASVGSQHKEKKIWQNDVLFRHLIPCYRKSDNVAGMYDKSWNDTKCGTGSFIVGQDIPKQFIIPIKKSIIYIE